MFKVLKNKKNKRVGRRDALPQLPKIGAKVRRRHDASVPDAPAKPHRPGVCVDAKAKKKPPAICERKEGEEMKTARADAKKCQNPKCGKTITKNAHYYICKGCVLYHFCGYICMRDWCRERMKIKEEGE